MDEQITPATPPPGDVPPTTAAPAEPANPFSRMVGVLFSPGETFESIARRPDWLVPLIVIMAVSLASFYLVAPKLDYEAQMRDMFENNPNMTEAQKERAVEQGLSRVETMQTFGMVTTVVWVALLTLILTAIFWGSLRAFGADNTFKQTFSVVLYSWIPQVIKGILITAIAMPRSGINPNDLAGVLKSNLGAFMDRGDSPALYALLSSIDLFNIWVIVLLVLGLSAISGFARSKVATTIVVLFAIYVAIKVGFAALIGGIG